MSIRAVEAVLMAPISPPTLKLTAIVLANALNDRTGQLNLSHATVGQRVGISRSQAQRNVRALIDAGLVSVTANAAGGKPGSTPYYRLHLDHIAAMTGSADAMGTDSTNATPTGSTDATGGAAATGSTDAQEGSHPCTGRVAPTTETGSTGATQTVLNRKRTGKEPGERPARRAPPDQLLPDVNPRLVRDWIAVRTAKRAGPLTSTAVDGLRREATKAGLTVEQAIQLCCERGWQALSADWPSVQQANGSRPVLHTDDIFDGAR